MKGVITPKTLVVLVVLGLLLYFYGFPRASVTGTECQKISTNKCTYNAVDPGINREQGIAHIAIGSWSFSPAFTNIPTGTFCQVEVDITYAKTENGMYVGRVIDHKVFNGKTAGNSCSLDQASWDWLVGKDSINGGFKSIPVIMVDVSNTAKTWCEENGLDSSSVFCDRIAGQTQANAYFSQGGITCYWCRPVSGDLCTSVSQCQTGQNCINHACVGTPQPVIPPEEICNCELNQICSSSNECVDVQPLVEEPYPITEEPPTEEPEWLHKPQPQNLFTMLFGWLFRLLGIQ